MTRILTKIQAYFAAVLNINIFLQLIHPNYICQGDLLLTILDTIFCKDILQFTGQKIIF